MSTQAGSGPGPAEKVFQRTDPFRDAAVQQETDPPPPQSGADEEDGLRLAGVMSENPFARSISDPGAERENGDRNLLARRDQGAIDRVVSENDDKLGRGTTVDSDAGLGAGGHFDPSMEDGIGPRDVASTSEAPKDTDEDTTPARTELEELNSNINHDRAERGTDVFALVNPPTAGEEVESSALGPDDISSSIPNSSETSDQKPRVAFAGNDTIDKAPSHDESSSSNDDESPGFLEKIISKAKEGFHLLDMKSTGPFKAMNPTNVRIRASVGGGDSEPGKEVGIIWRSRDNRKGRNSVVIPRTSMAYPNLPSQNRPVYSSSFKGVGQNLYRMAFSFPYCDMAFWSGWSYTWGSVLFVIDGVWAWGPVGWDVKWEVEADYVIGIFFFVGALLYQLGATIAYLEAVNDGSFSGSAMKRFLEGHEDEKKRMLDDKVSHFFGHLNPLSEKKRHAEEEAEEKRMAEVDPSAGWKSIHRRERPGSIYPGSKLPAPRRGGVDLGEAEEGESHEYLAWRWWPTWEALRTHHRYEIGYVACSIQLFGATLFSWCGLVSIPGISSEWESNNTFYGAYWLPEIWGSCLFLGASFMFLVETQEHWWKIQPLVMGWWIGIWAMIGSWGFLLNGIFGVVATAKPELEWAEFASVCCTTWGSFAYMCSALCQWYEAVNKHPVEELFNEPGDMNSWQVEPA